MRKIRWLNISLAAKCRLLFGVAVLLILTAALYIPWNQMRSLTDDRYFRRALEISIHVQSTCDLAGEDWTLAQERLIERWPVYVNMSGAGDQEPLMPMLVSVEQAKTYPPRGFIVQSIANLKADPVKPYTHKIHRSKKGPGYRVRLARAVRPGPTEPNPGQLLGIIHVEVHKPASDDYWNLGLVAASAVGGGGLAVLVFYLITARLILSPVRKLRRVAEQVTTGDINVQSQIETGDEFEELSEAFNDMLSHLRAAQEELVTTNRSLDTRLGELAETNVTLFESNKLKSQFLANVSHELRTPLVSIIGFAELLRDAAEAPPKDAKRPIRYANNILISGRMLLDLINDLLDLAKIEAGKIELHLSEVSLQKLGGALMDFVRPLADKKNLTIELRLADELPLLRSDSGKINQILYNLLSNAIKFTPTGGRVDMAIQRNGQDSIEVRIEDSGPGIPPEQLESIFEQFRQLDSSATREHEGTGLGLTITRELTHMLGGKIQVLSTEGEGSTFIVTLPIRSPKKAARRLIGLV